MRGRKKRHNKTDSSNTANELSPNNIKEMKAMQKLSKAMYDSGINSKEIRLSPASS